MHAETKGDIDKDGRFMTSSCTPCKTPMYADCFLMCGSSTMLILNHREWFIGPRRSRGYKRVKFAGTLPCRPIEWNAQ
ncbi:hypothetical protein F2P81_011709 [Scophthalmus maximus]|uniref:Uncharacterized protein n=1 Tax=Scophthalmus maximus TaxID=52904 RepID=A0A6A4SSI1_SCOMX|nr:hypothetical protein F2P81_011709 [Scophthalmus maximus]